MRPWVRFRDGSGASHELVPGDVLGRTGSARLSIDDPRVSEAHAMVSLRDGVLKLLSLRGAFALRGQPLRELILEAGQQIALAPGLLLEVEEVSLPDAVLAVEGPDLPRQPLPSVASLLLGPTRLVARYVDPAAARLWTHGDDWRLQVDGGPVRTVDAGDTFDVDGRTYALAELELRAAGHSPTRAGEGIQAPLVVVASYDTAHVLRQGVPVVSLSGVQARLISELAAVRGPIAWTALAAELWSDDGDAHLLRARLDTAISRLRRKLREGRVRTDLVRTDGAGQVELLLYPHDAVEDRT
ncbi:MAG: helix-turn-helix domain-containing protein [Alphaproteobacteria bacterium]|nr:helix-turn-helix domain-containing protein [Alphaproteobacteria bacterium]